MAALFAGDGVKPAPIAGTPSSRLNRWCQTGASTTKAPTHMTKPSTSMTRSDMIQALYEASGRTNGLYTGLWHEFAMDLAANFRDQPFTEENAAYRKALMGKWAND